MRVHLLGRGSLALFLNLLTHGEKIEGGDVLKLLAQMIQIQNSQEFRQPPPSNRFGKLLMFQRGRCQMAIPPEDKHYMAPIHIMVFDFFEFEGDQSTILSQKPKVELCRNRNLVFNG